MAKKEKSDELIVVDAERYRRVKKALEARKAGDSAQPPGPDEKESTRELVVVDVGRYKKVKQALAESEERYRQLFENVPIGIYRTTPDGRIVDANPALVKMLGYGSFAELAKRNLEQNGFEPGYDRGSFIRLMEREGEIRGLEAGWKKKDGSLMQVRENAKLIRGDDGQVFFEGTVEDITRSKEAEDAQRRHTRQIEILNVIISRGNLAESLPEMLDVILDCVSELLEFDTASVFLLDREAGKMNRLAVRGAGRDEQLSDKYMALENPPFANVLRGEAVYVDRAREKLPDLAASRGWEMTGSIPLVSKGRVIGALNAASCRRDAFSSEEKNLLEMIGKEVGTLISKLQTETALRVSEKYYRTLVETSPDFVFSLGLDGTMTMVNRRFLQFSGFEAGDVVGHNVLELVSDMDPGFLQEGMRSLVQSNEIFFFEYPVRRRDGTVFPMEMALSVLTGADGRPSGIMGVGRDISERKRAEEAKRIRSQQIEILNCIISQGNLADSLGDMLEKTLECVLEPLGFDSAGIYMYDPEARKVGLQARRGAPSQFYLLDEYMAIENMPFSQVLLRGQPVFADHLPDALPDLAEKWGWRMACVVPLVSKGRIIGALGLASCQREFFTPEEKSVLELIGKEAGTLISKLQTEAALRESEKYYRTLIDTSPDIIVVMDLEARLITVNQQFLKAGGYFYDEVIGGCAYDFVAGLDRDLLSRRTEQFIAKRIVSGSEYVFRMKDGRTVPLDVSAGFLLDDAGNPRGIIAIGRDASERKRSELAIEEKNKVLATLNEISLELASMPPASDINDYIANKLMSITRAVYVGINHYNKDTRQLEFAKANTSGKILQAVNRILGNNVRSIKYDVSEAMYKEITREVIGYRSTLHEASFGSISKKAGAVIQRLFNVDHFIGMALVVENELIGTAIMAMARGTPAVSGELLRSFSHLASVSLRRQQAECQLVASEEKFKKLFYISPDSIILSRLLDNRIVSVNTGFTRVMGYEESEVVGKTTMEINLYENPEESREIFAALRTKGSAEDMECWLVSKSGTRVLGLVSVAIIEIDDEKYVMSTIRDITERKRAEEDLRFLSSITENITDAILVTDADFRITYVNQVAEQFFGYTLDDLRGETPAIFNAEAQAEDIQQRIYETVAKGETYLGESLNRRKDGSTFYCEYKVMPLRGSDNAIRSYFSVQRDISERKKSENALRVSEETFRRTFAAIPSPAYMWVRQEDGRIVLGQCNQAARAITHGRIDEMLGIEVDRLYADRPGFARKIKAAMEDGVTLSEETRYTFLSTGETKWLVVDYVRTGAGHVMVITRDISERKEAEQKLLAYQEQLRALNSELLLVEERERRRIAADLHDQIGQNLALCKLKVAALEKEKLEDAAKSELSAVRRLLECSIQDARSLIFDLSPPVLYELGFEAALEWLADRIGEQYRVPVEFECQGGCEALELDRQVILFQVVRELLVNIGKHSQASRAKVIMSLAGRSLKIQVNDDGRGFDASQAYDPRAQKGSFGFFSMRERLNYLGGMIDLRSKPGMGTQVALTVPLPEDRKTRSKGETT